MRKAFGLVLAGLGVAAIAGAAVAANALPVIFPELRKARTFAPTFLHSDTVKEPAS